MRCPRSQVTHRCGRGSGRSALPPVLVGLLFGLVGGTGCVKPLPNDFVDAEMFGRINGKDWAYKHAYVDPTVPTPEEDDVLFVFLPYVPKAACPHEESEVKDTRNIRVAAPQRKKLTKLKAGTHRNLVFQYDAASGEQVAKSAKKGKIVLTSITADKVTGRIYAQSSDDNWVSGNFSAVLCNSLDLR